MKNKNLKTNQTYTKKKKMEFHNLNDDKHEIHIFKFHFCNIKFNKRNILSSYKS